MNNGILPVIISQKFLEQLFTDCDENPKCTITIDLQNQTITNNKTGDSEQFDINPYKKECLINGLDDIDFLLSNKEKIEKFEKNKIN